jgi:hypothetical protein
VAPIIATAPVPAHARLDTADTRDLALTALGQQAKAEAEAYEHGRVFGCTLGTDARDLARVQASFLAGTFAEDTSDLGLRISLLLTDPATPAAHADEIRASVRRWLAEIDDAETLLNAERAVKARLAQEYMAGAQATLDLIAPAVTGGHPVWEVDCIDGDTPLHVSKEWEVTIPSTRDTTTTLAVQVQQNDGEPADLWLDGRTVSVDDAEEHARNILAAVALGRRINAASDTETSA